jgi:hypothetical protein
MVKKEATVDVELNLGELKQAAQRAAKAAGISLNEFICNALQSRIRQEQDYGRDSHVRHGGKHLMGKSTGYEVTNDGKYYPAPAWTQQFEQLFAERQSIHNLVHAIVAQAQERLVSVEQNIITAKDRLIEDLGLDPSKDWVYYGTGYLEEDKPETKKK